MDTSCLSDRWHKLKIFIQRGKNPKVLEIQLKPSGMDCNIKTMEFKFTSDMVHHCVYISLSADNVEFKNYSTQTKQGYCRSSTPFK